MSGSGKPGAEIRSIVLDSAIFPALCFAGGNQRMPAVRADQLSGKQRCLGRRIVSGNLFRRLIDFWTASHSSGPIIASCAPSWEIHSDSGFLIMVLSL